LIKNEAATATHALRAIVAAAGDGARPDLGWAPDGEDAVAELGDQAVDIGSVAPDPISDSLEELALLIRVTDHSETITAIVTRVHHGSPPVGRF
jgi:hypothetical protein